MVSFEGRQCVAASAWRVSCLIFEGCGYEYTLSSDVAGAKLNKAASAAEATDPHSSSIFFFFLLNLFLFLRLLLFFLFFYSSLFLLFVFSCVFLSSFLLFWTIGFRFTFCLLRRFFALFLLYFFLRFLFIDSHFKLDEFFPCLLQFYNS